MTVDQEDPRLEEQTINDEGLQVLKHFHLVSGFLDSVLHYLLAIFNVFIDHLLAPLVVGELDPWQGSEVELRGCQLAEYLHNSSFWLHNFPGHLKKILYLHILICRY